MANLVLAIDPGSTDSAWVLFDGAKVLDHGIVTNAELVADLRCRDFGSISAVVIEQVESFGMAVGKDVFETVWWAGRMFERSRGIAVMLPRRTVKLHLCQTVRGTDATVRRVLLDRWGGAKAVGTTRNRGPLYGLKTHEWQALALAVVWADHQRLSQKCPLCHWEPTT
jgi:hypothetical protein